MKNIYSKSIIGNFIKYDSFLAYFAFLMPISENASTLMIFACLFLLIVEIIQKKLQFKWRSELLFLPVLYIIYIGISIFLSGKIETKWFEQKASLLVFPLLFSTTYKYNHKKILTAFVCGCIIAYLICVVLAFNNSLVFEYGSYRFNPLLNESRGFGFFKSMIYEGNYFFGTYFSRLIQTSYFALYLSFAISILLFKVSSCKWWRNIFIFIFVIGILQTASLAGVLNLLIIVFVNIFYKIKSTPKKVIIILGCFCLALLSIKYHPRINTTFKGAYKTIQGQNSPKYPKQPRLMTWMAASKAVEQHGVVGVGVANSQKVLNKKYKEIDFQKGINENLNAHNQYLQILLECGVLGFITLLFIVYIPIKKIKDVKGYKKPIALCFFLLISINFMFESILNRYIGISFFAFFISMINNKVKLK